jgi:hypothetical protein
MSDGCINAIINFYKYFYEYFSRKSFSDNKTKITGMDRTCGVRNDAKILMRKTK